MNAPTRAGYVLTEEGEELYAEWRRTFDGGNCSCHISPPCSSCTHEGNPLNLECTDDAWIPDSIEPAPLHTMLDQWR